MNLPNKLTILRICLIPVFVVCFYIPGAYMDIVTAAVFIVAFLTDIADGYIARKLQIVTNFGKFMDPIADKLLALTAYILLCERGSIPAVAVVITVARELIISAVRLVAANGGKVIAAGLLGKLKTVLQCITVAVLLVETRIDALLGFSVGPVLVWTTTAVTVLSCVDYIRKNAAYIDLST